MSFTSVISKGEWQTVCSPYSNTLIILGCDCVSYHRALMLLFKFILDDL